MAPKSRLRLVKLPPMPQPPPANLIYPLPGLQVPEPLVAQLAGRRRHWFRPHRRELRPGRASGAYRAPADPLRKVHAVFDGLLFGPSEHCVLLDGRQPVRVGGGEVVATAVSVALDERFGAELLQAGAGRDEGLPSALGAGIRVLKEAEKVEVKRKRFERVGTIEVSKEYEITNELSSKTFDFRKSN